MFLVIKQLNGYVLEEDRREKGCPLAGSYHSGSVHYMKCWLRTIQLFSSTVISPQRSLKAENNLS